MLRRQPLAAPHIAVFHRRVFERPHHTCTNSDNAPAVCFCPTNRKGSRFWYAVWFIKRQEAVKFIITGRRNPGGVRNGCELRTALAYYGNRMPIEHEARGWRFECD